MKKKERLKSPQLVPGCRPSECSVSWLAPTDCNVRLFPLQRHHLCGWGTGRERYSTASLQPTIFSLFLLIQSLPRSTIALIFCLLCCRDYLAALHSMHPCEEVWGRGWWWSRLVFRADVLSVVFVIRVWAVSSAADQSKGHWAYKAQYLLLIFRVTNLY